MYLSRVEIDLYNRKKIRELKHIGCYHGWIEDAFPDERDKPKSARSRKLWRIDNINDKCYLLILSESKPDFKKLEKYGIQHSACTKNYDEFLNSLKEGMRAKFRIKLNTVKSYSKSEVYKKRGRVAPVSLDGLNSFFIERTEKNGFFVKDDEFRIIRREEERFEHYAEDKSEETNINLVSATYEGVLTITDLEKFKQTLTKGIGRKKAYGFGFLTIIPIK